MRNRSTWLVRVISVSVCAALVIGAGVPSAFAAPKGKPGVTPPGVPPGQPFQALQNQITTLNNAVTDLDARVDALEAAQTGLMWINPLGFRARGVTTTLNLDPTGPGLVVAGAGTDVLQLGLQVPVGSAVTGATVCYVAGTAASYVSGMELLQYAATPSAAPTSFALSAFTAPAASAVTCVNTAPALSPGVDPSSGGAAFLSLDVSFGADTGLIIRAVGLQLAPAP